jgi:hypothetical protein
LQDQAVSAATTLEWRTGNVARVAFVLADAPPHDQNLQDTIEAALGLRRLGVRLYGLAASGALESAEYMMRLVSLITGARYAWLTDDSGIGDGHAEPKVICYQVTRLDQLLIRVLKSELLGRRMEADESEILREVGGQVKGICLVDVDPGETSDLPIQIIGEGADLFGADGGGFKTADEGSSGCYMKGLTTAWLTVAAAMLHWTW